MAFTTHNYILTALEPIKLTYKYNDVEEKLKSDSHTFDNGFSFVNHIALSSYQDAAFSRHNCLLLTDVKSLKQSLEVNTKREINFLGDELTNNSFYLKTKKGHYVHIYRNKFYLGGIGKRALFNMTVVSPNIIELKTSATHYVLVEQDYPYELFSSEEYVDPLDVQKKRFEIDFYEKALTIKCTTNQGSRFLSFGVDKQIRATGTELNSVKVNSYYFYPEFLGLTTEEMRNETQHELNEVTYFNEINGQREKQQLLIDEKTENDTNLLISCTTLDLSKNTTALANIAILKSNFDSTGVYTTK